MSDTFGGSPDISSEALRILIPGGTVFRAGRSWVDPDGGDLAVLVIEDAPPGSAGDRDRCGRVPGRESGG